MPSLFFHLLMFALTAGGLLWLGRTPTLERLLSITSLCALCCLLLTFLWWRLFGATIFYAIELGAWQAFLYMPALALGAAWTLRGSRPRLAAALTALGLLTGLAAVDAFLVEPHWLERTRYVLRSERLEQPLRIVLLADLQTDRIGPYERRVLDAVAAADADLVLFAGDYLQTDDPRAYASLKAQLIAALQDAQLQPPLGIFAVRGDVDGYAWPEIFATIGATAVQRSASFDLGPIALTALDPVDSRASRPPVPQLSKFHVVLGHAPDYALARPSADLLLAGHVHGGQVRLPFFGPPFTLSRVPRAWAAGLTELPWGGWLLVSRGIGLERAEAPRMRLLCRPELAIIDLEPL